MIFHALFQKSAMYIGPYDQYPTTEMVGTTLKNIGQEFDISESGKANIEILRECIGADCWGIYIRKRSGTIIPRMNVYALDPSLRKDALTKRQYEREQKYRSRVMSDINILLDELTKEGDSANVVMFEEEYAWMIECVRAGDDEYTFNVYAKPSMLQRI